MSQQELPPKSFQSGPTISEQPLLTDSPFTFEEFANQPEYVEVNRDLIKRLFAHLPQRFFHVDIATGTGLVPKLLIQQSQERGHKAKIIGIDPNPTSLEIARRTTPQSDAVDVLYLEGFGQDTEKLVYGKISPYGADSVSIHDALHEIEREEDKRSVLNSMVRILKPGGFFSFNSAFTTEGLNYEGTKWGKWKLKAIDILGEDRVRGVKKMAIYKPEQYEQMVKDAGLTIVYKTPIDDKDNKDHIIPLTRKALEAISKYPAFIQGVFADMKNQDNFSLEKKSRALKDALEELKFDFLPRGWYEIIARKPLNPISP